MSFSSRIVQMLSDDRGELDAAPIMVIVGVSGILFISAWDVIENLNPFNAIACGGGCAALVASLLASKQGDAQVRKATPESMTTTTTTQTTASAAAAGLPPAVPATAPHEESYG